MPPKRKSSWVILVLLMLMLTASNGDPSTTKSGTSSLSVVDSMVGLLWRPLVCTVYSSRRLGGLGLTYILYQGPTPTPIMLVQNRATSYNRFVESAEPAAYGTSQRSTPPAIRASEPIPFSTAPLTPSPSSPASCPLTNDSGITEGLP